MRYLVILILSIYGLFLNAQDKDYSLSKFRIESSKWICTNFFYDTLGNSKFRPIPVLDTLAFNIKPDSAFVKIENIMYKKKYKMLWINGTITRKNEFKGWGSEALIFAAQRIDTISKVELFSCRTQFKHIDLGITGIISFKDFDFCYSNGINDRNK